MTSFLIVHGWQNRRPDGHWQNWLARQLTLEGHEVCYPQLPDADHPRPAHWAATIRKQLDAMGHHQRVVVCHSLGCMALLHLVASSQLLPKVDRILFVAPPSASYLDSESALAAFQAPAASVALLAATTRTRPRLVCSDNDPYCAEGAERAYPTGFDVDLIPDAGHLDIPAGYGSWSSVLKWCNDPTVRITARPSSPSADEDLTDDQRIMSGLTLHPRTFR